MSIKFVVGNMFMCAWNLVECNCMHIDDETLEGTPALLHIHVDPTVAQSMRNQAEGKMLQYANEFLATIDKAPINQAKIEYLG